MKNFKKSPSQQKHAMRIICNKGKFGQKNVILVKQNSQNFQIEYLKTLQHLCTRLMKKLLRMFFFQSFKNSLIFTKLDPRN